MTQTSKRLTWKEARPLLEEAFEKFTQSGTHHLREEREDSVVRASVPGDPEPRACDETVSALVLKADGARCILIRRAIAHGDKGNYGKCEGLSIECQDTISTERLRAVPWATQCITCASGSEDTGQAGVFTQSASA